MQTYLIVLYIFPKLQNILKAHHSKPFSYFQIHRMQLLHLNYYLQKCSEDFSKLNQILLFSIFYLFQDKI